MDGPTHQTLLKQAARRLREEFQELTSGIPHNLLKGQEAERALRRFLNDHLPRRFHAGSGFVIDRENNVSPQMDVVIYDALNCPVYRASEEAGIFPADNVAAVVEVKSDLDKAGVNDAGQKIHAVKRLVKLPLPPPPTPLVPINNQTLGMVFAFGSSISLDKISDHYADLFLGKPDLGGHIDAITVLDRGVISLIAKVPGEKTWGDFLYHGKGPGGEGTHVGIGIVEEGFDSLDHFLRFMLVWLSFFWHVAPFASYGAGWDPGREPPLRLRYYLLSLTDEEDPEKRTAILERYRREVIGDLAERIHSPQ